MNIQRWTQVVTPLAAILVTVGGLGAGARAGQTGNAGPDGTLTIDFASAKAMKSRWADYFGTHYARTPEEAGVVWNTVRSYGGTHVGFYPAEDESAPVHTGPFTGRSVRLQLSDFHGPRGGPSAQQLIPDLTQHKITAIYLMTSIVRPSTEPFDKDLAYWAIRLIHEAYPEANRYIVWQIGNEIVSGHFDPKEVWTTGARGNRPAAANREDNFFGYDLDWKENYYVNDYLAPAVEAIERVARDLYGDPRKIRIALGSMNPYNRQNLTFLKNVMARRFDSRQAPTLQGDEVWKHFDLLTVHYMTGSPQTIATLQQYHDEYLKTGQVKGIWITEDHGRAGRGPVTILDRGLRFLAWAARNHLSGEQTRLSWWGERERDPGGPGAETTALVGEFFAGRDLYFSSPAIPSGTAYVLSDGNDERIQRIMLAFVPDRDDSMSLGGLQIRLPAAATQRRWTVEAIQYSATKPGVRFTPACEAGKEGLQIALNRDIPEPALLMLQSGK